jgi:hypothetical protein
MRLRNIDKKKTLQPLLFRKIGECSKLNGSSRIRRMHHLEFKEYGEALLAVANSMNVNRMKTNINKGSSLQNKPR